MRNGKCPFCGQHMTLSMIDNNTIGSCNCPNCGRYSIKATTLFDFESKDQKKKHIFSGYIREMNELKLTPELITDENYINMLSSPMIPKTIMEKLDKILLYIYRRSAEQLFQEVEIDENMPAIAYAKNSEELSNMLDELEKQEFLKLKYESPDVYVLSFKGMQRAESLQKEIVNSTQCFVAMCFSDDMNDIYNKHIKRAVEDAVENPKYKSLIISQKEYNDKICDQIIAEIRKSKFLIADFTGNRGGVYFEAGFALGLGLPVIWTCQKKYLKSLLQKYLNVTEWFSRRVHFFCFYLCF